jgi:hypothetical protein
MTRIRMGLVPGLLLALAVAACGGGDNKTDGVASLGSDQATATTRPGGSDPQQAALAYARCMRQHGVNVADPSANGLDLRGLNSDSPKVEAAEQACQQHKPNRGNQQTSSGGGR